MFFTRGFLPRFPSRKALFILRILERALRSAAPMGYRKGYFVFVLLEDGSGHNSQGEGDAAVQLVSLAQRDEEGLRVFSVFRCGDNFPEGHFPVPFIGFHGQVAPVASRCLNGEDISAGGKISSGNVSALGKPGSFVDAAVNDLLVYLSEERNDFIIRHGREVDGVRKGCGNQEKGDQQDAKETTKKACLFHENDLLGFCLFSKHNRHWDEDCPLQKTMFHKTELDGSDQVPVVLPFFQADAILRKKEGEECSEEDPDYRYYCIGGGDCMHASFFRA